MKKKVLCSDMYKVATKKEKLELYYLGVAMPF